jgi:tRNA dimethylallyltransferase
MRASKAICLMGPTAAGKTDITVQIAEILPIDVISVDSALVYRGMDIGTAKPDAALLQRVPHRLVDIRDPEDAYSAGEFLRDAQTEIERSLDSGRVPLLVGGTMMYFRALTRGLAELPRGNAAIRAEIDAAAKELGWPALHEELVRVDPQAAGRIQPTDSQRIQRALEVYRSSGRTMTDWQSQTTAPEHPSFLKIALLPPHREVLHRRIAQRLESMMKNGFVDEVRMLRQRDSLGAESASMRAVGYRQIWSFLDGQYDLDEAARRALYATRQLAKRQLTWLRSERDLVIFDPLEDRISSTITTFLQKELDL